MWVISDIIKFYVYETARKVHVHMAESGILWNLSD